MDVSKARAVDSAEQFDRLLSECAPDDREVIVAVYKKASGRQTVSFNELLETAISHGWVDTQTRRIDDERYAIRYVRRRPESNWSPRNREIARRLIAEGRMKPAGRAVLPADF